MSTGKSELLAFLTVSIGTLIGLYVLHIGYGTYLDQRFNSELAEGGPAPSLVEARTEQATKLASGRMPIEQAMQKLAGSGRDGFAGLKPIPSTDLSAVSGWVHHPGFKAVVAHPIRAPRAVEALPAPDGAAVEPGQTPAPTAVPTAVPATAPAQQAPTHAPH